ncbi:UNVERIFIED_CONTAM: hypothetical protein Slati_0480700 [Sesamum latifolium]|uniref:Uncharacterized protein n=1 Tax=Sesamum latifolium TaxID=2727402 RepID=A0AAW2Y0M1_9LAMI
MDYQDEVAKIVGPYFQNGFAACKEQFMAQGYPPAGEETSFLDLGAAMENAPDPFVETLAPVSGDLPPRLDHLISPSLFNCDHS